MCFSEGLATAGVTMRSIERIIAGVIKPIVNTQGKDCVAN